MTLVGRVESLWRYPVKSMRGEPLAEAYLGYGGIFGDRRFAFVSSAAPDEFPYMTARDKQEMLLHRACYLHPEKMVRPSLRSTGGYAALEVETPAGERLAVEDPRLIDRLRAGLRERHELTMIQSDAAITDSRPVSLISLQTLRRLSEQIDMELDKRRFRANLYIDLLDGAGFAEDEWVGRRFQIGPRIVVEILKRNKRCKIITLDPETSEPNPEVMRLVAREHESCAGIYAAVLREGMVSAGNEIRLMG